MRLFIAVLLPDEVKEGLSGWQSWLKDSGADVRWVRSENIHLTLKFLGETAGDKIETINKCLEQVVAGYDAFQLRISGIGVFPDLKRARVLWAGISEGTESAGRISRDIDTKLAQCGFPAENRLFKAHLTIGRFRTAKTGKLQEYFKADKPGFSWQAKEIVLMQSILQPAGPVYNRLAGWTLAQR